MRFRSLFLADREKIEDAMDNGSALDLILSLPLASIALVFTPAVATVTFVASLFLQN